MRKLFLVAVVVIVAVGANAQNKQNAQGELFPEYPSVETTQSVSFNIPAGAGLHYAYEYPLGRLTTIVGRVGVEAGAMWGDYIMVNNGWFEWKHGALWMIVPSIDIEPRFYYGLDRRSGHGRSTYGNAGSFLALQMKNVMPFGYVSDSDLAINGATALTPMWGLRRVWGGNWLFEFTAGTSIAWGWAGGSGKDLHLGVRFGYSF